MKKWENLIINFRKFTNLKRFTTNNIYLKNYSSRFKTNHQIFKNNSSFYYTKIITKGNLEFCIFFSFVGIFLYYIHKKKKSLSETVRLAAAGILTHSIVDVLTYMSDKINTKAKVEYFYLKKNIQENISKNFHDINNFFNKKFVHYIPTHPIKKKKKYSIKKSLGNLFNNINLKGIQPALIFLVFNSAIFYGLYKNIKYFLREKLNIEGFMNFFLSAGISQFFAMLIAFPLENMKTRMQASNFNYETITKHYMNLLKTRKKNNKTIKDLIKIEYSGFFSHLLLYVVYESITFGIYEYLIKYLHDNEKINKIKNNKNFYAEENNVKEKNFYHIIFASGISGIITALITNPIDVYQINKQINPNFKMSKLNPKNSFAGLKERVVLVTLVNLATFIFLESIGPGLFNVQLE